MDPPPPPVASPQAPKRNFNVYRCRDVSVPVFLLPYFIRPARFYPGSKRKRSGRFCCPCFAFHLRSWVNQKTSWAIWCEVNNHVHFTASHPCSNSLGAKRGPVTAVTSLSLSLFPFPSDLSLCFEGRLAPLTTGATKSILFFFFYLFAA